MYIFREFLQYVGCHLGFVQAGSHLFTLITYKVSYVLFADQDP